MGLLATDPALVRRGEIGKEQGEDNHMEKPGGQSVDGVMELSEEGFHCVTSQLKGLLELKVKEVTLVDALKERDKSEIRR